MVTPFSFVRDPDSYRLTTFFFFMYDMVCAYIHTYLLFKLWASPSHFVFFPYDTTTNISQPDEASGKDEIACELSRLEETFFFCLAGRTFASRAGRIVCANTPPPRRLMRAQPGVLSAKGPLLGHDLVWASG